jgi:hypothetical protein
MEVALRDIQGRQIPSGVPTSKASTLVRFDGSGLSSGTYLVRAGAGTSKVRCARFEVRGVHIDLPYLDCPGRFVTLIPDDLWGLFLIQSNEARNSRVRLVFEVDK